MKKYKRIVIKIGSANLVHSEKPNINSEFMSALCKHIAHLHKNGHEIILVSSGAMAMGRRTINMRKSAKESTAFKQAVAAIGQIHLMNHYQQFFAQHDIIPAQILLSLHDTEDRQRHLNARNTINTLLELKTIPIINENDSVATEEIRYGDNDRLSARVAGMIGADLLILISDIDGLYTKNPKLFADAQLIPNITKIDKEIMDYAGANIDERSTGGMTTKLLAAQIAMAAGVDMIIMNGAHITDSNPFNAIWERPHSMFHATQSHKLARKKWLVGILQYDAEIIIDNGALAALQSGKSLLPAGIKKLIGQCDIGAAIHIRDEQNNSIGIGLASHDGDMLNFTIKSKQAGKKSDCNPPEFIHRDNLALYN